MKVCVFHPRDNTEHQSVLAAFGEGLRRCGVLVRAVSLDSEAEDGGYRECDVAVVFGVFKLSVAASRARGAVFAAHRARGGDVVVLEKGYIRRDVYYAAGWNGLNRRADFNMPIGGYVPSHRFRALGVELRPMRLSAEKRALLVGQIPWDASCQHVDLVAWLADQSEALRGRGWDVRFRPHPLAPPGTYCGVAENCEQRDMTEDFEWATQVVTFNSNIGVDAALAGVPVSVADEGSMAWGVASATPWEVRGPTEDKRLAWAARLAHCQWSREEMAAGEAWRWLTRDRTIARPS